MKTFGFRINGEEYEISIDEKENNIYEIELNGVPYKVEYENKESQLSALSSIDCIVASTNDTVPKFAQGLVVTDPKTTGTYIVKAPLPGNIIKIPVKVGQHIKRGDSLLTLESMKMENDILSEKNAIVKAIHVKEGDAIMQDYALMEME